MVFTRKNNGQKITSTLKCNDNQQKKNADFNKKYLMLAIYVNINKYLPWLEHLQLLNSKDTKIKTQEQTNDNRKHLHTTSKMTLALLFPKSCDTLQV